MFKNRFLPTCFSLKQTSQIAASLVLVLQLTACGGGGGGGGGSASNIKNPVEPAQPIDLSGYANTAGIYEQQTVTNAATPWTQGYKGLGITIGIVDSGISQNHYEFYNDTGFTRIDWKNARGVESTGTLNIDYVDIDAQFHGTHIAAIAAGRNYGLAPEATLLPVNVFFNNDSATSNAIFAGIEYLANKAPIINASITDMVNFSTAGGIYSEYTNYSDLLQNNNTVLVTAAGNDAKAIGAEHFTYNSSAQNLSINAQITNQVLHAVALNDFGAIANFSNYPGSCADVDNATADLVCDSQVMADIQNNFISVPGVSIVAASGTSNTASISYNGTSMAAPIVSGGLAVLLSAWDQLTPQQAASILKSTANNTGIYGDSATYGVGLMDLDAAMAPLGVLKSSASVSSPASVHTLTSTTAVIPTELKALAKLPALKSVAYFDDYNRDFLVDLSPVIQVEKNAINWPQLFNNAAQVETQYSLENLSIQAQFNPKQTLGINSLQVKTHQSQLGYDANSTQNYTSLLLPENSFGFMNAKDYEFGSSLNAKHLISPNFGIFAAIQSKLKQSNLNASSNFKTSNQSNNKAKTIGFEYYPKANLRLSFASQLINQTDQLFGTQTTGALQFGENNLSQNHVFSASYQTGSFQVFGLISHANLLKSEQVSGSYINIENAQYAQIKLGLKQQQNQHRFGVQTFNSNTLVSADIKLALPYDMSANKTVLSQNINYRHKGSLLPDSLELFYQDKISKHGHYQFNLLKTPDDLGLALQLKSAF